jgi:hypothetical protein
MAEFLRPVACFLAVIAPSLALAQGDESGGSKTAPVPGFASENVDSSAETTTAPAGPKLEHLGGANFRLGDIRFNQKSKEITLSGKVNMKTGYLEYAIVNEFTGKIHESLLTSTAAPLQLNIVFLLLGYKPSESVARQETDTAIPAQENASFDVLLRWSLGGKEHEVPLEEWVHNLATESKAKTGPWLYTGSKMDDGGYFAAESDGSILAIHRDARSLANNPREGKFTDEIWKPAVEVPAKETPVEIVFSPHQPKKAAG